MPKKTKKEKIIAEYRRRMQSTITTSAKSVSKSSLSASPTIPPRNTFHFTSVESSPSKTITNSDTELKTIKLDLAKTIFLAAIAILVELILSWQLNLKA